MDSTGIPFLSAESKPVVVELLPKGLEGAPPKGEAPDVAEDPNGLVLFCVAPDVVDAPNGLLDADVDGFPKGLEDALPKELPTEVGALVEEPNVVPPPCPDPVSLAP